MGSIIVILVDRRVGSVELAPYLRNLGMTVQIETLSAGDVCFEGKGPEGNIMVGVERKRTNDILSCIDDGRFSGFQQPGMMEDYHRRLLIVEGLWKPSATGLILEYKAGTWIPIGGRRVLYDKLFGFLLSVQQVAGTVYVRSGDIQETAYQIKVIYQWFQKEWGNHTSMSQPQNIIVPSFEKPSFERKFACLIDGIGVKRSKEVVDHFKNVPNMVHAEEQDWMKISRIGVPTAIKIVRQIRGVKL